MDILNPTLKDVFNLGKKRIDNLISDFRLNPKKFNKTKDELRSNKKFPYAFISPIPENEKEFQYYIQVLGIMLKKLEIEIDYNRAQTKELVTSDRKFEGFLEFDLSKVIAHKNFIIHYSVSIIAKCMTMIYEVFSIRFYDFDFYIDESGYIVYFKCLYELLASNNETVDSLHYEIFYHHDKSEVPERDLWLMDTYTELNHFNKQALSIFDINCRGMFKRIYDAIIKELNYAIPKQYVKWTDIARMIAISSVNMGLHDSKTLRENLISDPKQLRKFEADIFSYKNSDKNNYSLLSSHWFADRCPLFIVDSDLIDKFLESDFKIKNYQQIIKIIESLNSMYPSLLLLFPKDKSFYYNNTMVNLGKIDHCYIRFFKNSVMRLVDYDEGIEDESKNVVRELPSIFSVRYGMITDSNIPLSYEINSMDLDKLDEDNKKAYRDYSKNIVEFFKDSDFLKIVIQCLVLISTKPELILTTHIDESGIKKPVYVNNKGFKSVKTKPPIRPRILDLRYGEKNIRNGDTRKIGGVKGTPKRPHWRFGYKGKRYIGKKFNEDGTLIPLEERDYVIKEIETYYVWGNGDDDLIID